MIEAHVCQTAKGARSVIKEEEELIVIDRGTEIDINIDPGKEKRKRAVFY